MEQLLNLVLRGVLYILVAKNVIDFVDVAKRTVERTGLTDRFTNKTKKTAYVAIKIGGSVLLCMVIYLLSIITCYIFSLFTILPPNIQILVEAMWAAIICGVSISKRKKTISQVFEMEEEEFRDLINEVEKKMNNRDK